MDKYADTAGWNYVYNWNTDMWAHYQDPITLKWKFYFRCGGTQVYGSTNWIGTPPTTTTSGGLSWRKSSTDGGIIWGTRTVNYQTSTYFKVDKYTDGKIIVQATYNNSVLTLLHRITLKLA